MSHCILTYAEHMSLTYTVFRTETLEGGQVRVYQGYEIVGSGVVLNMLLRMTIAGQEVRLFDEEVFVPGATAAAFASMVWTTEDSRSLGTGQKRYVRSFSPSTGGKVFELYRTVKQNIPGAFETIAQEQLYVQQAVNEGWEQTQREYAGGNTGAGTPLLIFDKTFTVPRGGTYSIEVKNLGWSMWAATRVAFFTLVIDEGTGAQQIHGGNGIWQVSLNTASVYLMAPSWRTTVALTAGLHTFRVYAQNDSASGSYLSFDATSPQQVTVALTGV